MATYIFMWNPAISSFTRERYVQEFEMGAFTDWSIREYEHVKPGDEFYMFICGDINALIAWGKIMSWPYNDDDWSNQGRKNIHYVNLKTLVSVNPFTADSLLTSDFLASEMPDFQWHGGSAGRLLPKDYAQKLRKFFKQYIKKNPQLLRENVGWDIDSGNRIPTELMAQMLDRALYIVANGHEGQRDKTGKAYFLHPMRVAMRCSTDEQRLVALLHDIIEDTRYTAKDLSYLFPKNIVNAILSVTNREGESYEAFVARAKKNTIGRVVKLHDLEDNLDVLRLTELDDRMMARYNKYLRARRLLLEE